MLQRFLVVCCALVLVVAATSCQKPLEVTGTATFRGRGALPVGAVLEVQLADVSRTNAPAVILAKKTYNSLAAPPYPFVLRPDARDLNPHGIYAVQARIVVDGKLYMVNKRRVTVNKTDPTKPLVVHLDPVPTTIGE
ncbi:MAG: YbaY family lipoprotein [Candidatus Eisenbacteria bacterium]